MSTSHFHVDIADVEDIRSKLPEVRSIYASKLAEFEEAEQEMMAFRRLVNQLAQLVGEEGVVE